MLQALLFSFLVVRAPHHSVKLEIPRAWGPGGGTGQIRVRAGGDGLEAGVRCRRDLGQIQAGVPAIAIGQALDCQPLPAAECCGVPRQIQAKLGQFRNSGRTLVLLTGDGNDNTGWVSFIDTVERALREGWTVEVWAWRGSTSRQYMDFASEYRSRCVCVSMVMCVCASGFVLVSL